MRLEENPLKGEGVIPGAQMGLGIVDASVTELENHTVHALTGRFVRRPAPTKSFPDPIQQTQQPSLESQAVSISNYISNKA